MIYITKFHAIINAKILFIYVGLPAVLLPFVNGKGVDYSTTDTQQQAQISRRLKRLIGHREYRADLKCGKAYDDAICDPFGEYFCCNNSTGWCGNTDADCTCGDECTDYRIGTYRSDERCGKAYADAICNPSGDKPCCKNSTGFCGSDSDHCNCGYECTDYRISNNIYRGCGIARVDPETESTNASQGAWPWLVQINKSGKLQCGGTIISQHWIVSAAHCFFSSRPDNPNIDRKGKRWFTVNKTKISIHVRSTHASKTDKDEINKTVEKIVIHPNYNQEESLDNDIALIKVNEPFAFKTFPDRPICLPDFHVASTTKCFLAGYGDQQGMASGTGRLHQACIRVKDKNSCSHPLFTTNMFCAAPEQEGIDACHGDTGGPLICKTDSRYTLYGIISWGIGCGLSKLSGYYTKTNNYVSWIIEHLNSTGYN